MMRIPVFASMALFLATPLLAQSSTAGPQQPATPGAAPQTVTMTGCVTSGSESHSFVLNNPMVVPTTQTPPGSVSSTGAVAGSQPPTTAPSIPPAVSPSLPPAASPTPPSTAGTAAGTAAAGTVGTSGAAVGGASGTSGSTPTAGSVTGEPGAAASGGSAAPIAGYRLTGSDLTAWAGQRVEIMGTVVKTNPGVSTGAGAATAMPEFRVQSVRPIGGSCGK